MPSAGDIITVPTVPGSRIATQIETSDSGAFTAITTLLSVTAPLVAGRVYRVRADTHIGSETAGDDVLCEIREDDSSGVQLQRSRLLVESTSGFGWPIALEGEFTATATASKTFVLTAMLSTGTGDLIMRAAPTRPAYLYVDYIRDA